MQNDTPAVYYPPAVMEMAFLAILCTDSARALPLWERLQNVGYEWNRPDPGGKVMGLAESQAIANVCIYCLTNGPRAPIGTLQLKHILNPTPQSQLDRSADEVVALATDPYFQPDLYLEQFDRFIRLRAVAKQLAEATSAVNTDDLEEADRILTEVQQTVSTSNEFVRIEMSADAFFARRRSEQEECNQFRFPVRAFEELYIAPRRGRVLTIGGGTHKGKSTLGREIIYMNLRHHPCMHISIERGDEPDIGYVMHALHLTKRRPMTLRIPQLVLEDIGTAQQHVAGINYVTREFQGIQNSEALIREHETQLRENLYLYRESPGVLTFKMVGRQLRRLQQRGITIDMVLIDYPSLMKIDHKREKRLEEARLAQDFSQLAGEFNVAAISISQVNAEGNKALVPSKFNLNESIDKSFLGDDIIMIAQNEKTDLRNGITYVISDKVRGEDHGFAAVCTQCLYISQFCMDSHLISLDALGSFSGSPVIGGAGNIDPETVRVLQDIRDHLTDTNRVIAERHSGWTDERVRLLANRYLTDEEKRLRPSRGGRHVN
jgi:hypothetical protein